MVVYFKNLEPPAFYLWCNFRQLMIKAKVSRIQRNCVCPLKQWFDAKTNHKLALSTPNPLLPKHIWHISHISEFLPNTLFLKMNCQNWNWRTMRKGRPLLFHLTPFANRNVKLSSLINSSRHFQKHTTFQSR